MRLLLLLLACWAPAQETAPKSAILILGDGMGWGHLQLYRERLLRQGRAPEMEALWKGGVVGVLNARPIDDLIPESAGASSMLATGVPMRNRAVSRLTSGEEPPTLLERARKRGKSAGLVTTGRLTHAIPAPFIVHAAQRDPEILLAEGIANSGMEILLGGGSDFFPSKVLEKLKERNVTLLRAAADLSRPARTPVLGLFAPDYLRYSIDGRQPPGAGPSLAEMTRYALEALSRNPEGFVLVLDARLIDESSHNTDAAAMLAEMAELDRAAAVALEFAAKDKKTLVLMTSPHETGGPALVSTANPLDWTKGDCLDLIAAQKGSFRSMFAALWDREKAGAVVDAAAVKRAVEPRLSPKIRLSDSDYARIAAVYLAGSKEARFFHGPANAALAEILAPYYRVRWTTGTHTDRPLPLFARGPEAESFRGWIEAWELTRILCRLLKI